MPMRAVTDAVLEEMTRRLVEEFQPEQVILFGSYAWGVPHPYSDVDLMVIVGQSDLSDYEHSLRAHRCLSEVDRICPLLTRKSIGAILYLDERLDEVPRRIWGKCQRKPSPPRAK
jgi:predicted nucleotidyltransferase